MLNKMLSCLRVRNLFLKSRKLQPGSQEMANQKQSENNSSCVTSIAINAREIASKYLVVRQTLCEIESVHYNSIAELCQGDPIKWTTNDFNGERGNCAIWGAPQIVGESGDPNRPHKPSP